MEDVAAVALFGFLVVRFIFPRWVFSFRCLVTDMSIDKSHFCMVTTP